MPDSMAPNAVLFSKLCWEFDDVYRAGDRGTRPVPCSETGTETVNHLSVNLEKNSHFCPKLYKVSWQKAAELQLYISIFSIYIKK